MRQTEGLGQEQLPADGHLPVDAARRRASGVQNLAASAQQLQKSEILLSQPK